MKKLAVLPMILLNLSALLLPAGDQELDWLSSRIQVYLQEKGWSLEGHLIDRGVVYDHWRSKQHLCKLSFFTCKTESEAARRLQDDVAGIKATFGAGNKVAGLTDEGYEWPSLKDGQVLVEIRKRHVIVAVVGQSLDVARHFAEEVASLLAESLANPSA